MAPRTIILEIGDRQFVYPNRRRADRSVKVQSSQTVKGAYERRVTRSQSDLRAQHNEFSQMYHEWLRPAPSKQLGDHESHSINRLADDTMQISLTPVGDHDSTPSSRSDLVSLGRRVAVKRNSTKDENTETEKHDSMMQSIRVPEMASTRSPAIQPAAAAPPSDLRRFSFEVSHRDDAIEFRDTLDFEVIPITPVVIAELECHLAPVLEDPRQVQVSTDPSQPQLYAQAQQDHKETREERDQMAELRDLDRERRRVLTTFDEILGERKIPTALL